MPKSNPFDSERSKRKQIMSNIFLVFTSALVIILIIWVIVSKTSNTRTKLDLWDSGKVSFSDKLPESENEFTDLYNILDDKPAVFASYFVERFPETTKLLNFTEDIDNPKLINDNAQITYAHCYQNSYDKNLRQMDVLILPYSYSINSGDTAALHIDKPFRYTISYNIETKLISLEKLRTEVFRLNFYSIKVSLYGVRAEGGYKINLNSPISDKDANLNGLLESITTNPAISPTLSRDAESSTLKGLFNSPNITASDNLPVTVSIRFGDLLYDSFEGIEISLKTDTADPYFMIASGK